MYEYKTVVDGVEFGAVVEFDEEEEWYSNLFFYAGGETHLIKSSRGIMVESDDDLAAWVEWEQSRVNRAIEAYEKSRRE